MNFLISVAAGSVTPKFTLGALGAAALVGVVVAGFADIFSLTPVFQFKIAVNRVYRSNLTEIFSKQQALVSSPRSTLAGPLLQQLCGRQPPAESRVCQPLRARLC